MKADFYLSDRRALAGYFEKEWFDHVVAQKSAPASLLEFAPFPFSFLHSDHHEQVADFVSRTLTDAGIAPTRLLEIGSALGRGLYEIYRRTPSLQSATMVEPSDLLATTFNSLFSGAGPSQYPVLSGNSAVVDVTFDSSHITKAVRDLRISLINTPHTDLPDDLGLFDLVTCFNVVDNCEAPLELVERLKRHTAPGGLLALSCTYQWSRKFLGTPNERANRVLQPALEAPTRNVNELFREGWSHLNEADIEFKYRKNERHWLLFLSHVSIFQMN